MDSKKPKTYWSVLVLFARAGLAVQVVTALAGVALLAGYAMKYFGVISYDEVPEILSALSIGAPYLINKLTFNLNGLFNVITWSYLIALFCLIGYVTGLKLKRIDLVAIIGFIVLLHCVLSIYGGQMLFADIFDSLKSLP